MKKISLFYKNVVIVIYIFIYTHIHIIYTDWYIYNIYLTKEIRIMRIIIIIK